MSSRRPDWARFGPSRRRPGPRTLRQNVSAEPQNRLVHRDCDDSRHSPLGQVDRDTIKDLQLEFVFSVGGGSTGGTLRGKEESTPLVDDGFMYVTETWSRVMKFDVRSGAEAIPLWRCDPKNRVSRTTRGLADADYGSADDLQRRREAVFRGGGR